MSSHLFHVQDHVLPAQHIREYPRATAGEQEDVLHLAVKQYTPLDNLKPEFGDVTIIGAHANGFPKELYEPLWDEILERSKAEGFRIRSIWIADVASQGDSGVLNERLLGNDPGWHDHARDLLHLINVKRLQMPRPIIGIGHSFGGTALTYLSLLHPRLIATLVLLDPVIISQEEDPRYDAFNIARMSMWRRDLWPSQEEAITSFKKSKFYASWDSRVLERWFQHSLRKVPTILYPDSTEQDARVTLKTPKHQEVFTFLRPSFELFETGQLNRKTHPDVNAEEAMKSPFVRPESLELFWRLPNVRPSVLYVFGEESDLSTPTRRQAKIDVTGTGIGGNGGASAGRVKEVVLKGVGHLMPMEAVGQCGASTAEWIGSEVKGWKTEEEEFHRIWAQKSMIEKTTIDEKWREMLGGPKRNSKAPTNVKL